MARWIKPALLVLLLAGAALLYFVWLKDHLTAARVNETLQGLRDMRWAPAAVIAGYAVLTVLGMPGTVPSVLIGATYGVGLGFALVVAGSNLGAWGAFWVARTLGRGWIESKLKEGSKLRRLDAALRERGLLRVIQVRLIPLFPFNLLNFACGLTSVRFRDYALGTFLGMLPATFVVVYSSASLAALWLEGGTEDATTLILNVVVSLALLVVVSLAPAAYKRLTASKSPPAIQEEIPRDDGAGHGPR
ncbi:MAG TPA: TVP38/TMEM64 family protein [Planctomycetota bacterium]|nr:TVP38/TMEM64 family protein [Planctomycetota bacterium]